MSTNRAFDYAIDILKAQAVNPWAVCTASAGRADKEKYERCVQDVKAKHPIAKAHDDDDPRRRIERRIKRLNSGDPDIEDKKREAREERSIAKSKQDAPNYKLSKGKNNCANCGYYTAKGKGMGHCSMFDFMAKGDYVCDS